MASIAGCSSSATDIGTATVDGRTYSVEREGDMPASGVSTQLVIKPTDETMKPDTVMMWVGLATDTDKTAGVFDPNDGDYDVDLTCPNPLPAGSLIWFDITVAGQTSTGSIAIK
ncbi:MAG TPA: hypothetical protein VGC41_08385 [Kofleriaceae bacterium]